MSRSRSILPASSDFVAWSCHRPEISGLSTAAYCAAGGMECVLLTPPGTSPAILAQAQMHGARVVMTTWDGRQVLFEHLARQEDWFPLGLFLPRPVHNPFGIEGYKTFAYETIDALGEAPAAMLFPCARGNGLYGAWKGFCEAERWGWIDERPAMVACQPVGANSLEVSIQVGSDDSGGAAANHERGVFRDGEPSPTDKRWPQSGLRRVARSQRLMPKFFRLNASSPRKEFLSRRPRPCPLHALGV